MAGPGQQAAVRNHTRRDAASCHPPAQPPGPGLHPRCPAADQIWPDWAIRLTDENGAHHDRFRSSALVALLLPHSDMPLNLITALVSGQLKRHIAGYHMGKLRAGSAALRILTELAFALDAHDIPVNYQRRRELAASTALIDDAAWSTITRDAEHACGGPLIHRNPRHRSAGTLTPLGEQLRRQARDYLGLTATSPDA